MQTTYQIKTSFSVWKAHAMPKWIWMHQDTVSRYIHNHYPIWALGQHSCFHILIILLLYCGGLTD